MGGHGALDARVGKLDDDRGDEAVLGHARSFPPPEGRD
jgi:hypothetical protein